MSLKHAMTSMLELKLIDGERTMSFSKNRQGLTDQSISYRLTTNKIEYNFSELNFKNEMSMINSNSEGLTLEDIKTLQWIAAHREDQWIT